MLNTIPEPTASPAKAGEALSAPPVEVRQPESSGKKRRPALQAVGVILGSLICYFIITQFVLMSVEVKGMSMSPTLHDGDHYILDRFVYLFRKPHPGEIVVIKDPEDEGLSVKRIVGGPKDIVELRVDGVYVNGALLDEPYLTANYHYLTRRETPTPVRLAENQYFLLGDNRNNSADSRIYGPVSRNRILGYLTR